MAREPDPQTRPISVAELLARDNDGSSPETGPRRDGGRRGREGRGREGSISVAELTGEQPRIRGGAHSGRFPAIDAESIGDPTRAADTESSRPAPGPTAPPPTFPPSESLTPPTARSTFPRADDPLPPETGRRRRATEGPDTDRSDGGRSGVDHSVSGIGWSSPSTRDFHRDAVQGRLSGSAPDPSVTADTEETGVIPRFGAPVADDDFADLTPEERDRAFESYRNFDDIDEPEPTPRERRRGLGRWLRGRSDASGDSTDDEDEPTPVATTPDTATPDVAVPDVVETERREDIDEIVDLDRAHRRPEEYRSADDRRSAQTWEPSPDVPDASTGSPGADSPGADSSVAERGSSPSPARQWAMLGLQVVGGLVVGVGLFLGFTELWRWNVYFALVLAVVVVFGMVTVVHAVRRTQDLVSTLLALGVGLVVTLGPLALLASGS